MKSQTKKYVEDFFAEHNNSIVTALMLPDYVGHDWQDLSNAEAYYRNLPAQFKQLPQVRAFGTDLEIALNLSEGKQFPEVTLPDITGKNVSIASLKGKYVLVNFWRSGCLPCIEESSFLLDAYKKFYGKSFEIVTISFDNHVPTWKNTIEKANYAWINLIDSSGVGKGVVSTKLGIKTVPRNFLLDRTGKIIARNLRGSVLDKKLGELLGN